MKTSLARPLAPMAIAAALVLSACSAEEASFEEAASAPSIDGEATEQNTDETNAEGDAEIKQASAAAAGIDLGEVGEPEATVTLPAAVEGDPDATIDVSLYSLTRNGQAIIGVFSFTVNSDQAGESANIYDYLGNRWLPYLVDSTNLTRHDVLSGSGVSAVTDSINSSKFGPGDTIFGYAAFAAPPADVTTMGVSLVDSSPLALDVPIK